MLGFALAGGGTNWNVAQNLGSGRSDAFQFGLYGTTRSGPLYLAGAFAFANHWMSTNRISFAGDALNASFNAQSYSGRLEAGYRYAALPTFGITPYAAVQVENFQTPTYSETNVTGGGFGLTYNAMNSTDTRSELGARFDAFTTPSSGLPLVLRGRVAWAHDWVSNPALDRGVRDAAGRGLHRQRRAAAEGFRADDLRRRALLHAGAVVLGEIRRPVRLRLADLRGNRHAALYVVELPYRAERQIAFDLFDKLPQASLAGAAGEVTPLFTPLLMREPRTAGPYRQSFLPCRLGTESGRKI